MSMTMTSTASTAAPLTETLRRNAAGIEITGVNLAYGATPVLKDVNLTIHPGEFFAFLGPSGCGKTTLLRLIAGFNAAQSGTVRVGGEEISSLPPWKRDVGMVFQSYALWPHMSVAKNVAFGLEERKLPRDEVQARVAEALDLVGLRPLMDRKPSQLSGGQQQRVALARTIAIRPRVLLLDEPLSNLDAKMRVVVRGELRELQQRLGITTIFVTHDQEEANTICDRIAVMQDGRVQQVGTPMALYDRPCNLFVANFLGTANILAGAVTGEGAKRAFEITGVGRIPITAEARLPADARFVFRPQDARLAEPNAPVFPGAIRFAGTVRQREFLGSAMRYAIALGETVVLVEMPHRAGTATADVGASVLIDIDGASGQFLGTQAPAA